MILIVLINSCGIKWDVTLLFSKCFSSPISPQRHIIWKNHDHNWRNQALADKLCGTSSSKVNFVAINFFFFVVFIQIQKNVIFMDAATEVVGVSLCCQVNLSASNKEIYRIRKIRKLCWNLSLLFQIRNLIFMT